jgi:hypothetical protein
MCQIGMDTEIPRIPGSVTLQEFVKALEMKSPKTKKGALGGILCGVAVLQSCGWAVRILIEVRGEPHLGCLSPKGEFWERSST